eukprot:3554081-Pleurochrysis_carterae.AAC.2
MGKQDAAGDLWSALPDYTAIGPHVRMGGRPFQIKGASWFGAEGSGGAPDGLWVHNIDYYVGFLAQHGFNAIRLPFAMDNAMRNRAPQAGMTRAAPELNRLPTLDILERVVDAAAEHGIVVLLDLHRVNSARWPDAGLWYGQGGLSLEKLMECWDVMQARFCNRWNVLGADIFNEPHGAAWSEWAAAATRLGDFVLSKCARWLIFVEGVAQQGARNMQGEFFWGENLEGARAEPVRLAVPNKLVYSPHVRRARCCIRMLDHEIDCRRWPSTQCPAAANHFAHCCTQACAPFRIASTLLQATPTRNHHTHRPRRSAEA